MKIIFNEKNNQKLDKIYLKDKSRLPSVTDVRFINRELIVIAHRYACKLYLIKIDFENEFYEILDTYLTIDENKKVHFCESFEIKYNEISKNYELYLIFFSNYIWIFDINMSNYKFISKKLIKLNNGNRYHGIKIYNNDLYLTPSNMLTYNKLNNVLKLNLENYNDDPLLLVEDYLSLGDIKDNYRLKDISFVNNDYVLLIINYKTNIKLATKNQVTKGAFVLFTFPLFQLLDKIEFNHIHFDKSIIYNNFFFVTGQDEESGKIYKGTFDLNHKKIILLETFIVDDFPHGLDTYQDLFAYTSYGSDSVNIDFLEKYN